MKNQKLASSFLIISLVAFGVGYVLTNSTQYGICTANEIVTEASCINLFERIGDPVFYGAGALTLVFLVLIFFRGAFSVWKKFAIWFVPLAALLFIFYPDPGSGDLFSPYPETVFKWVSGAYVVVSLLIIARVAFKNKAA